MTASYNVIEKALARMLGRFPKAKGIIKTTYQRICYLFNRSSEKCETKYRVSHIGPDDLETFFGYYDKSPCNGLGYVLVHMTDKCTKFIPGKEEIYIAVFKDDVELIRLTTKAYNWQQGSRCMWLDDDLFIFNDFDEEQKRYCSRVYSICEKREINRISYAVQDAFRDDYIISVNYRRLAALRPDYGYRAVPALNSQELDDTDNDGIWLVSLRDQDDIKFISLTEVIEFHCTSYPDDCKHKVNHVLVSPSGESFIFMHRYISQGVRTDRLILSNRDGNLKKVVADFGMVSHCAWVTDDTLLGFLRGPNGKDGYWLISISSGDFTGIGSAQLAALGDGHPNVYRDKFVTDSYPDKARMQTLMLHNFAGDKSVRLGRFYHGFDFNNESRCDLHPRVSRDGNLVYFDSVYTGKRKLCCIRISN